MPEAVEPGSPLTMQPRADCERCSWSVGPSAQARERALVHANRRGHRVRVITEHIAFYDPRETRT
jgi:hypothetical protein